jgi:hypothetical protein
VTGVEKLAAVLIGHRERVARVSGRDEVAKRLRPVAAVSKRASRVAVRLAQLLIVKRVQKVVAKEAVAPIGAPACFHDRQSGSGERLDQFGRTLLLSEPSTYWRIEAVEDGGATQEVRNAIVYSAEHFRSEVRKQIRTRFGREGRIFVPLETRPEITQAEGKAKCDPPPGSDAKQPRDLFRCEADAICGARARTNLVLAKQQVVRDKSHGAPVQPPLGE